MREFANLQAANADFASISGMSDSELEQSHLDSASEVEDEAGSGEEEHHDEGEVDVTTKKKRKAKKKAPVVTKKRRLEDIKIHKEKKITLSDLEDDDEDDEALAEEKPQEHPAAVEHKSGVLYIQTIPPMFTPTRVREHMERFGDVGRIYLATEKRRFGNDRKAKKIYVEGWVEFKKKRRAKQAAEFLNNQPVGGKRRTMAAQTLWSVKYLKGFKWIHLVEQLNYESKVDRNRMQTEISQAKRKASHFVEQIEKGEHLKRVEEKAKKDGGNFEVKTREIRQRQVFKPRKQKKKQSEEEKLDLMKMIYG
ncbi:hypothetical protein L596_010254 [Steinernema carpocapsae]|uniref:Activator of basal transcription 1 n=1 Tax=Steinernema carpocapsae TaxID=34508 RepID=A0A4U5PHT2_STECR|nr:hypothetical protein L596_010254 [Steinernema carpocapsae]